MASSRSQLVGDAYRRLLFDLRASLERGVTALYGLVDADDLDAAFARFSAEAAPLIAAGQASAATLAAGYLRALFEMQAGRSIEPGPTPDGLVGVTEKGVALADGMAAFPGLVKAQIGQGRTPAEALAFGRYLALRFADSEVVRVADATTTAIAAATPQVRGWRGTVSARACDTCRSRNAGEHALSDEPYRHGDCGCSIEYFVA